MTQIADSKLILQRAYQQAADKPDVVYMTQPMGEGRIDDFTWSRAMDEARRMANHIASLGLPPNSQIGILSKNCAHFILSDLAIWMAGHVSVALYPTLPADTVRYILEHAEVKLLFVGKLDTWDEMKAGVPDDLPCISYPLSPPTAFPTWNDIVADTDPVEGNPTRPADDMALIIYTSGSTGQPKGVMHSFNSISLASHGIVAVVGTGKTDRMLSYLPLAHALERWLVECVSLVTGMHIFFAESVDTFVDDLKRARPTVFMSVPRLWLKFQLGVFQKMPKNKLDTMLKIPILKGIVKKKVLANLGLDQVRFAGSGSAPIPGELIAWYRNLGLELLEGYGMSENFSYSHVSMPGKTRVGYVGSTYPEVECRLSDEGEILVYSPATMLGYFKQEELTEASFIDIDGKRFLKTGDRGVEDEHGRLRITGRTKELFKTSKGKYIAPVPIENVINNHPSIESSCVSGSGYPAAHAVVQLAEDLLPSLGDAGVKDRITGQLKTLLKQVNDQFAQHEQLQFLAIAKDRWTIDGGFLTPTLKIKRAKLEQTYGPKLDGWYDAGASVLWES